MSRKGVYLEQLCRYLKAMSEKFAQQAKEIYRSRYNEDVFLCPHVKEEYRYGYAVSQFYDDPTFKSVPFASLYMKRNFHVQYSLNLHSSIGGRYDDMTKDTTLNKENFPFFLADFLFFRKHFIPEVLALSKKAAFTNFSFDTVGSTNIITVLLYDDFIKWESFCSLEFHFDHHPVGTEIKVFGLLHGNEVIRLCASISEISELKRVVSQLEEVIAINRI